MTLTTPRGQPSDTPLEPFKGASAPNVIGYRFTDLDPGANIYLQRDDRLVIQAISSVASEIVNVNIRLLQPGRPAGRTQPDAATVDNRLGDSPYGVIAPINAQVPAAVINTTFTKTIDLSEGYLMSIAVNATVAVQRGQTFVRIFIIRGSNSISNVAYLLGSDYVTTQIALGWPFGEVRQPLDGPGQMIAQAPAAPAAGADFTLTFPTTTRVHLISCSAILTTSAVVGNRIVAGVINDLTFARTIGVYPANIAIPASTVCRVTFAPGAQGTAASALIANVNLPQPTQMTTNNTAAQSFSSLTAGILAGDQWSGISALFETWYDI